MAKIRGMTMKYKIIGLAGGLWCLAMIGEIEAALAQERSTAANIAVIDVQFVMWNADAAKKARGQIEDARLKYQKEFKSKQDELDKIYESVTQQRTSLSQDVYQKRVQELQQKSADYQRDAQERQTNLDAALGAASRKIAAVVTNIVDEIIKEKKYALVLPRSVSIGTPTVPDITQEVLKQLNQRTPSIPIALPK